MNSKDDRPARPGKPEISRYMFAMFDVLGFSNWVETAELQSILDSYHSLIESAVHDHFEKGALTAIQTPQGSIFALTGPPSYAYFSDTILLWCPLSPAFVDVFVGSCKRLICEALMMGIPLRGALTNGDAVLDAEADYFIGKPIVEAANLEKGQNWIGLTFGNAAAWSGFLAQIHGSSIIEYNAPMKEKYADYASPIVIDWPRYRRDEYGECPSEKLRLLNTNQKYNSYWKNAIEFARYSQDKHDWYMRPDEIRQMQC